MVELTLEELIDIVVKLPNPEQWSRERGYNNSYWAYCYPRTNFFVKDDSPTPPTIMNMVFEFQVAPSSSAGGGMTWGVKTPIKIINSER